MGIVQEFYGQKDEQISNVKMTDYCAVLLSHKQVFLSVYHNEYDFMMDIVPVE